MAKTILTKQGLEKLQKELELLKTTERSKIAQRIQAAKELGDLSENAEYSEAMEQRSINDSRVSEIENIIKNAEITQGTPSTNGVIKIGSTIITETNKQEKEFIIVGSNEADPLNGKISNESPLGQAFIGKKRNDVVSVTTPKGEIQYTIVSVQ